MDVRKIIAKPSKKIIFDPKGFFTIFLSNSKIIVEHYNNISSGNSAIIDTGKLDVVIEGKNALEIGQTLFREQLISRMDHSFYLGTELMKAEIALKNELPYEQCHSLQL